MFIWMCSIIKVAVALVQSSKKEGVFVKVAKLGVGTAVGVVVNDLWEMFQIPGYNTTLFRFPNYNNGGTVGVGADDVIQMGLGALVAIPAVSREIGFGMIAGTLLTLVGWYFNKPVSIIPHSTAAAFSNVAANDNAPVYGINTGSGAGGNESYDAFKASKQTSSGGSFADENEVTAGMSDLTLSDTMTGEEDYDVNT